VEVLGMDAEQHGAKTDQQIRQSGGADGLIAWEDMTLLLRSVARLMARLLQATHLAVLVRDGDRYRPIEALGYTVRPVVSFSPGSSILKHLESEAGPASVCFDDSESAFWLWELPDHERVVLEDLCADVLAPIRVNGRLLAVVSLGPKKSGELYSRTELSLLRMLGGEEHGNRKSA
jgi:hypothetical protein